MEGGGSVISNLQKCFKSWVLVNQHRNHSSWCLRCQRKAFQRNITLYPSLSKKALSANSAPNAATISGLKIPRWKPAGKQAATNAATTHSSAILQPKNRFHYLKCEKPFCVFLKRTVTHASSHTQLWHVGEATST